MSRIPDLGSRYGKLPALLDEYERALDGVEANIKVTGKGLEECNKENSTWQHYYNHKRIELKTLCDFFEMQVARVRGKLFRSYTETSSRDLSDRSKDKYIDNEKAYLDLYELYLEVKEMKEKYQVAVDAFTTRGYALNNITKQRVASLEDVIL